MRTSLAAVVVLGLAAAGCGRSSAPRASPTTTTSRPSATTSPSTSSTSSSTTTSAPPPSTSTTTTPASAPPPIGRGARGPDVLAIEQRLDALGYWTGAVDGIFDQDTAHAVVALQKAAGQARDGAVGPATRGALVEGVRPTPRSSWGRVVEIDLHRQLLLVVVDGALQATFDTSTGKRSTPTPAGRFSITSQIDGLHRSRLGLLDRPKYFHRGIAIHGFTSVPATAASHGCVRVTYHAIDRIWAAGLAPIGTAVWVY